MMDRGSLRSRIIETLLEMHEINQDQAAELSADPRADFELERVVFDSMVVIDFCMQIETTTGIVIDPDEIAEIKTFNQLEGVLFGKQAS